MIRHDTRHGQMTLHPLTDHERECIAAANVHGAKLVVHPVHGLNRWTIEAGIGVEGKIGMRVRRCAQNCTRLGVITELGTDGGSELAVQWDGGKSVAKVTTVSDSTDWLHT